MENEKRLIDANALRTQFDDIPPFIGMTGGCVQQYIDKAPTVDAVSRGVHDQVRWERDVAIEQLESYGVSFGEKADVAKVVHGRWVLTANEEHSNYRWNVTAECSECHHSKGEIYAGFFSGFPKDLARDVVLDCAKNVKLDNYCPNCGADMRERKDNG